MSIVEHALQKNRTSQRNKNSARRAGDAPAERAAGRAERTAALDPSVRLTPTPVALDVEECRERRLLIRGTDERDGGAIAAYRILRTRLLHRARIKQWTTIAVTSAGPNDGKTLTTINLAISMAREKSRDVVLLDMDMRNPSVCRTLGIEPPHEVRRYLENGQHGHEMFVSVASDNLMIAGSSMATEHASELLASPRYEDLINMVKQGTVDPVILLDLPPILLTDDAFVVAPKVDAFLIVASEGLTGRADLAKALDLLKEFPIAGIVLNRAVETVPDYDYGYESSYHRGSSENEPDPT